VVDVHLVDDGQVEVVLDDAVGDVRGQLRVADDLGDGAGAPPLVGGLELGGGADGEGGNEVQAEGRGVIVVDEKDDVGLLPGEPAPREVVTGEQRSPVRLLRLAVIDRDMNRMISLGGNIYFLAKIGASDGKSFQQMAGSMTGMSEDEYREMMVNGGRSVDGNRYESEWEDR
jgi:hypothetical protein